MLETVRLNVPEPVRTGTRAGDADRAAGTVDQTYPPPAGHLPPGRGRGDQLRPAGQLLSGADVYRTILNKPRSLIQNERI